MAASTADTVPPVADTCEAMQEPCVTNDCPWQAYFFGRGGDPAKGFEWTYHSWWGLEGITATFVSMWDSLKTNKKVAEMWPNDGDGLAWANEKTGQPPVLKAGGYTIIDGGRYQDLTDDYSAQIGKFKSADAEILSGVMLPPDFTNFWKQSLQQGFNPMIATVGKALLFPQSLEALGDIGYNLSSECWWSPNHPFKSSLTGQTCQEIADQYEKDNNAQWTQPILHYAIFEVVADALKRTTNMDDKAAIRDAVAATDMETIGGKITWSSSDKKLNPVPNVCTTPITGGQWVKGDEVPVRPHRRQQLAGDRGPDPGRAPAADVLRQLPGDSPGPENASRKRFPCETPGRPSVPRVGRPASSTADGRGSAEPRPSARSCGCRSAPPPSFASSLSSRRRVPVGGSPASPQRRSVDRSGVSGYRTVERNNRSA